jgi:murein hydrolase activator
VTALVLALVVPTAEGSLLASLERLDRELVQQERRLSAIEAERQSLAERLASLDAEMGAAKVRSGEALATYTHRLRALARMPAGARLLVFGATRSLADYLESRRVLRLVASHDKALHTRYLDESHKIAALTAELETRRDRVDELVRDERTSRDRLAAARQERLTFVHAALGDAAAAGRLGTEARGAGGELLSALRRLAALTTQPASFAAARGKLPWPAVGPLGAGFGQQVELVHGTLTPHNGVDIRAKAGTPVQAIAPGRVVFADWMRGYGQLVIVDHGDGYHSLVAHLGAMTVQNGDGVTTGAPLGTVGDTGSLRGTQLYFEIRKHGVPEDPMIWLRR